MADIRLSGYYRCPIFFPNSNKDLRDPYKNLFDHIPIFDQYRYFGIAFP